MATQMNHVDSGITPPASTAAPSAVVSREQSASIPNDPHGGTGRLVPPSRAADPGSSGRDRMNSLAEPAEPQNPAPAPPRSSGSGRRNVMGLAGGGGGGAKSSGGTGGDGPASSADPRARQQTPSKPESSRTSSSVGDGKSGNSQQNKDPGSPGSPTEPETISYSAERIIGNGSFGVVFQASVVETGEIVAIKKVLQDKRFKNRELQIMRQLVRDGHSNIVALKHCFYSQVSFSSSRQRPLPWEEGWS